jgi:23S rRNA (cytidine1920-2'-O)/16S rRNA (cytidine1409-2'-O)-methyltransferase
MVKQRLDVRLVELGLAESRSQAQRLVMAGQVRVDDQVVLKPATPVQPEAQVCVENKPKYVSRGGQKLEAALRTFSVQPAGRICADVGASTGGFTDCLLQNQAAHVYAIDVGQGILDWKLRKDPRVTAMEGTNARFLDRLPEPVSLVTVDVSFISLRNILPIIEGWGPGLEIIALVKPQFEAGRKEAGRGKGVIRDKEVHRRVLNDVLSFARQRGYGVKGLIRSPLIGPKGNAEFLAWLEFPGAGSLTLDEFVADVLKD